MSKKKHNAPRPERAATDTASSSTGKKIYKRSVFLFWFILVALLVIFGGRWLVAITNGYYESFVLRESSVSEAVSNMKGLSLTGAEEDTLLPLQQEWDLFTSSRLRDEVYMTASDGTELHAGLYDAGSSVALVVLPRFDDDSTADFLPGPWLYEATGCTILLPDQRLHGESGGDAFGYGYLEQQDLADWLRWAEENLGIEHFILWGEGTGANTILFAASSGLLPESVAFAVAESPYASLHEMASHSIWKWYTVPAFPFLNSIEGKLARSDAGYKIGDTDLAAALSGAECSLPVLFLQSASDEYILPEWTQAVYNAYTGEKEVFSSGIGHGTVYAYASAELQELLTGSYLPLLAQN